MDFFHLVNSFGLKAYTILVEHEHHKVQRREYIMKTFMKQSKKGFTLIEMIVVIVIVAILAAIAVPGVMKYIDDARDTKFIAVARPIFNDARIETSKLFSMYGTEGTVVDLGHGNTPMKEPTTRLIQLYLNNEYGRENSAFNGYVLQEFSIFFDGLNEPREINESKKSHELTKLALMFYNQKKNILIYVIARSDEMIQVFHSSNATEVFDITSEWYGAFGI